MRPVSTTGTEKLRINVYCTIGWTYVLETQGQNVFQMWNGFHRLIYLNTWSPKGHSPWKCEIFRGRESRWLGRLEKSIPISPFCFLSTSWLLMERDWLPTAHAPHTPFLLWLNEPRWTGNPIRLFFTYIASFGVFFL